MPGNDLNLGEFIRTLSESQRNEFRQLLKSTASMADICPSLETLVRNLSQRHMTADDLPFAQGVCHELARHGTFGNLIDKDVFSTIGGFTNRIVLYNEGNVEVRAHLFSAGSGETFIHNHQHSFISCCMQGEYVHKLHAVAPVDGSHFAFERRSGGIYTALGEKAGKVENILAQPFSAGQCLFISTIANHTVEPLSEGPPVVTITFRDKHPMTQVCMILHTTDALPESSIEKVMQITEPGQRTDMVKRLESAMKHYMDTCIVKTAPQIMQQVMGELQRARDVDCQAMRELYWDAMELCCSILDWHQSELKPGHVVLKAEALATRMCGCQICFRTGYEAFVCDLFSALPVEQRKIVFHCLIASKLWVGNYFDDKVNDAFKRMFELSSRKDATDAEKKDFLFKMYKQVVGRELRFAE